MLKHKQGQPHQAQGLVRLTDSLPLPNQCEYCVDLSLPLSLRLWLGSRMSEVNLSVELMNFGN